MKNQRYENHTRYFAFHHFVITPLTLLFLGWTVGKMDFSSREVALEGAYLFIGAFVLFLLPLLVRTQTSKSNYSQWDEKSLLPPHWKKFWWKRTTIEVRTNYRITICKRRRAPKFDGPGDCRQINIQRNKATNKELERRLHSCVISQTLLLK